MCNFQRTVLKILIIFPLLRQLVVPVLIYRSKLRSSLLRFLVLLDSNNF